MDSNTEQREGEVLPCGHPMTRFRAVSGRMVPIGTPSQVVTFTTIPALMCGARKAMDG